MADLIDGEELAAVFADVLAAFKTDKPNALLLVPVPGNRTMYDEPSVIANTPNDLYIVIIGDPNKESYTTVGDQPTSRTWFITDTETAQKLDLGTMIVHRGKKHIIRTWEIKEIRGVDLIGYGMAERVPG